MTTANRATAYVALVALALVAPGALAGGSGSKGAAKAERSELVDINSASLAQLKTLPGIGDTEARRIVAGRPFLSKADLASKKILPTGVYLVLKDRVIAQQGEGPKRKD